MRKLNVSDVFRLSKIYSKMDIKLEVEGKVTQTEMGAQLINKFISNLWKAEKEVIEFLSSVKGVKEEEFKEMAPKELMEFIKELMKEEGVADFFIQAMQ